MTPKFLGQITDTGEFKLNPGERERMVEYLKHMKPGEAELVIKRKMKRSTPFHRYFFGVVVAMVAQEFQMRPLEAYIVLMQTFRPIIEPSDLQRTVYSPKFRGISKMTTSEMIELADEIRAHFQMEYGVYIPEPNEVVVPDPHEEESQYSF